MMILKEIALNLAISDLLTIINYCHSINQNQLLSDNNNNCLKITIYCLTIINLLSTIDQITNRSGPLDLGAGSDWDESPELSLGTSSLTVGSDHHLLCPAMLRYQTGALSFAPTWRGQKWSQIVQPTPMKREMEEKSFGSSDGIFRFRPRRRVNLVSLPSSRRGEFVYSLSSLIRQLTRENQRERERSVKRERDWEIGEERERERQVIFEMLVAFRNFRNYFV